MPTYCLFGQHCISVAVRFPATCRCLIVTTCFVLSAGACKLAPTKCEYAAEYGMLFERTRCAPTGSRRHGVCVLPAASAGRPGGRRQHAAPRERARGRLSGCRPPPDQVPDPLGCAAADLAAAAAPSGAHGRRWEGSFMLVPGEGGARAEDGTKTEEIGSCGLIREEQEVGGAR
eukprot:6211970-Pleurochrysis_carterae.AAC.3